MKNILITGGSGFIGSHLMNKLKELDYNPLIFDSKKPEFKSNFIEGDIRDKKLIKKSIQNLEGVIHLAGVSRVKDAKEKPLECMSINLLGTMNILEEIKDSESQPWVVFGGTIEKPQNIYGLSKYFAENYAKIYSENSKLNIISLRFSNAYGSIQDNPDKLILKTIHNALNNKEIKIQNPHIKMDYIYIKDLVEGIICGMDYIEKRKRKKFEIIPLCNGKAIQLDNLVEEIIKLTHSKSKVNYENINYQSIKQPDPRMAERKFNFKAKIDIEEGLIKLIKEIKKDG